MIYIQPTITDWGNMLRWCVFLHRVKIREVRKTELKKTQIREFDREVSSVLIWIIRSSKKVDSLFPKAELTKRSKFLIKNFGYFLEPPAACYGNISIAWDKKKDEK